MKTISTTAIVAVITATIGLGAMAPAMAQPPMQRQMQNQDANHHRQFNHDGPRRSAPAGRLGGLLNFGSSSEQLEIAVVKLSHRIELTDEQKTMLETFKTDALAAQAAFASAIAATRPAADAAPARPDIVAHLDNRIAMEQAHLDALTAVQPSFTAFFNSLTDEQKTELMPQRQRTGWQGRQRNGAPARHPAQIQAPAAPTTPPAPPAANAPIKG